MSDAIVLATNVSLVTILLSRLSEMKRLVEGMRHSAGKYTAETEWIGVKLRNCVLHILNNKISIAQMKPFRSQKGMQQTVLE